MIKIDFTAEEIQHLNYERYHHPHPRVQRRMEVLYLKSQGLPHAQICQLCQISRPTLAKTLRLYQQGGIEGLKTLEYKGQSSSLNAHSDSVRAYFEQHPPRTSAEAQAVIEQLTGIKRSPTQIQSLPQTHWLSLSKSGVCAGKVESAREN
ncbi:hypothetical protein AM10699_51970 [Acaryochloris marina MBIC10699]|nr:hypothetical protein AM10699_13240 [Acaryochloris marina MBIC10699]BDM82147.1 hypothetical protein AM10699_50110 [Acaryochloris marina MBIC10699]BDM82333.1 hypothetical protein AM10699_51970 [Acaryochloris marina MBIC10699]